MDVLNFVPKKFGLTNNQLKIIAMISMLIDHIGIYLFPKILIFRIIGRLAFPIFAYMIAEGCFYTKNRIKYLLHLLILGLGWQLVYFFFMNSLYMGILITFSLSIILIYIIDYFLKKKTVVSFILMILTTSTIIYITYFLPLNFNKYSFTFDYGVLGVFLPVIIYFLKHRLFKIITLIIFMILLSFYYNESLFFYSLLAIPLLILYNGKRGKYNLKYMFYIFYPLHLVLIYLIGYLF